MIVKKNHKDITLDIQKISCGRYQKYIRSFNRRLRLAAKFAFKKSLEKFVRVHHAWPQLHKYANHEIF